VSPSQAFQLGQVLAKIDYRNGGLGQIVAWEWERRTYGVVGFDQDRLRDHDVSTAEEYSAVYMGYEDMTMIIYELADHRLREDMEQG
jgi:hypothetical protein